MYNDAETPWGDGQSPSLQGTVSFFAFPHIYPIHPRHIRRFRHLPPSSPPPPPSISRSGGMMWCGGRGAESPSVAGERDPKTKEFKRTERRHMEGGNSPRWSSARSKEGGDNPKKNSGRPLQSSHRRFDTDEEKRKSVAP